jgi:hypothetical protein
MIVLPIVGLVLALLAIRYFRDSGSHGHATEGSLTVAVLMTQLAATNTGRHRRAE